MSIDLLMASAVDKHGNGDLAGAQQLYREVLLLAPGHVRARLNIAILTMQLGDMATAGEQFCNLEPLASDYPPYWLNYGSFLFKVRDWKGAGSCFSRAHILEPENVYGLTYFIRSQVHALDSLGLAGYIERLEALGARNADACCAIASALRLLGNFGRAGEYCRRGLSLSPDWVEAALLLGHLAVDAHDFDKARTHYEQAVNNEGEIGLLARRNLVRLYIDRRGMVAARQHQKEICRLTPNDPCARRDALLLAGPESLVLESGNRLSLQPLAVEHANFVFRCYTDRAFMRLYNRSAEIPPNVAALRAELSARAPWPVRWPVDRIEWIVLAGASANAAQAKPIGLAALGGINFSNETAEMLVGFPTKQDGLRGATLKTCLRVLEFAFMELYLHKVHCFIYGDNEFALQNILGFGFRQEGLLRQHIRDHESGERVDLVQAGLLRDEYLTHSKISIFRKRFFNKE